MRASVRARSSDLDPALEIDLAVKEGLHALAGVGADAFEHLVRQAHLRIVFGLFVFGFGLDEFVDVFEGEDGVVVKVVVANIVSLGQITEGIRRCLISHGLLVDEVAAQTFFSP